MYDLCVRECAYVLVPVVCCTNNVNELPSFHTQLTILYYLVGLATQPPSTSSPRRSNDSVVYPGVRSTTVRTPSIFCVIFRASLGGTDFKTLLHLFKSLTLSKLDHENNLLLRNFTLLTPSRPYTKRKTPSGYRSLPPDPNGFPPCKI